MNFQRMIRRRLVRKVMWKLLTKSKDFQVMGDGKNHNIISQKHNILIDHKNNVNAPIPLNLNFFSRTIIKFLTIGKVRRYYYNFYKKTFGV